MSRSRGTTRLWIAGGILFGPLYGLLGHRWRVARSWVGPALVAGTLCLEPLARVVAGLLSPPTVVWKAEIVLGFVVAIVFGFMITMSRRARGAIPRGRISVSKPTILMPSKEGCV